MEINNNSNRPAQLDARTSQCMNMIANRIYESKFAIIGSIFSGVFGGGISYALTTTVEYSSTLSTPAKIVVVTIGTGVGMLSGGMLGAVSDYVKLCSPSNLSNTTLQPQNANNANI